VGQAILQWDSVIFDPQVGQKLEASGVSALGFFCAL